MLYCIGFMRVGYQPGVTFNAGSLATLRVRDDGQKVELIIKRQQLIDNEIDGLIKTPSIEVYNNINNSFVMFQRKILVNDHKSYYTEKDIEILDGLRTVVNIGYLKRIGTDDNFAEIDINKAFSNSFINLDNILIINEFDIGQECDNTVQIQDYDLYIVGGKDNICC